ncbi:hypothetical protein GZZ44_10520 [Klebsiella aerogenes]|uniref:phage baseplate protein n=1 Tax=Klebsiella aerogenes TaxID=548 RepID=UPI00190EA7F8|nr:hypothetical protein [Klebsiella aerogenes]MBK0633381.1 hypothetical protein [Klebsiella aerogenes]
MPLETAEFFNTLQPDWPLGTDPESQGDDHIRMIKQVIQNTFPAFDSAVLGSSENLSDISVGLTFHPADTENNIPAHWFAGNPTDPDTVASMQVDMPNVDQLNIQPLAALNWYAVTDILYPVGRVLFSSNPANPATYLKFGEWTLRSGYIYGAGEVEDSNGLTVGAAPGQVTGPWTVMGDNITPFTATGKAASAGGHDHDYDKTGTDNGHYGDTGYGGTHSTQKTGMGGEHEHDVSVTVGTGGNPMFHPGWAFYAWERTA